MKRCVRCLEERPLSDFWNHCNKRRTPPKDGKLSHCKFCGAKERQSWFQKNKAYAARKRMEWNRSHPEIVKKQTESRKTNPRYIELARKGSEKYRKGNVEKTRKAVEKWRIQNLDKRASYTAKRRSEKTTSMPEWANEFFISEAYDLAKRRSALKTGGHAKWHVDHIVPLKSDLVCGLHVEHNLQVVPAINNMKKGNRHWPDMPTGR